MADVAVAVVALALVLGAIAIGLVFYRRTRSPMEARSFPTPEPHKFDQLPHWDLSEPSPDGVSSEVALGSSEAASRRNRVPGDPIARSVFFGTDREVISHSPVRIGTRPGTKLHLGRVQVTIPPNHQIGRNERPLPLGPLTAPYDPMRHIAVNYIHLLENSAFFHELEEAFEEKRSAFVFVHGFATSFDDAARRTAQLYHDLKFPGPPLFFSWASAGKLDALMYNKDAENSQVAAATLRQFLHDVAVRSGVSTLHVIAHSMGGRALLEAIREWPTDAGRLSQIILVAPDVNKRYFAQQSDVFRRAGHRTTLYGSNRDLALRISRKWAGKEQRAGDAQPPIIVAGVETVDVSSMDIPNDWLNHFVLDDDRVLSDMKELIDSDLPIERRLRLEPVETEEGMYWRMRKF